VLRAGINLANPLLVSTRTEAGGPDGVAPALAAAVATQLGVPLELVPYPNPGVLSDRIGDDEWDIALIAADPARATTMTFSHPYAEIEASYLIHPGDGVASVAEADQPGRRIVAIQRSAYELWLRANLRHAEVVPAADAAEARQIFAAASGTLLAGLAPSLHEEARELAGTVVLPGRFMAVRQAVATARAHRAGAAFLQELVVQAAASGLVAALLERYGMASALTVPSVRVPFFIGTYSVPSPWAGADHGHGAGIVSAHLDLSSGAVEADVTAAGAETNPAYVVTDRARGRLWAVTETEGEGRVLSYRISGETGLTAPCSLPSGAASPNHITVDEPRSLAYVCHFHGGRLAVFSLDSEGAPDALTNLIELPRTPRGTGRGDLPSRPHCSLVLPAGELMVTDHGRHQVALYRVIGRGAAARLALLDALPLPVPTGPRHIAEGPFKQIYYVSNENAASVSVLRYQYGEQGPRLDLVQTAPSPGLGRVEPLPSEIAVHPWHPVVYMANRRDDSISVFAIDSQTGHLAQRQAVDVRGEWTRHFALTPDGRFLVLGNQDTDTVATFRVTDHGDLEWSGHEAKIASPANIRF
jgi:polar amino acid transport system substrate-binding protein